MDVEPSPSLRFKDHGAFAHFAKPTQPRTRQLKDVDGKPYATLPRSSGSPSRAMYLSKDEPGGLLSEGASSHLPAAAIPAIVSVFVDASSLRLWRAAPAVRPGMSSLDLERSWHLKGRVGVDVSLGTLQVGVLVCSKTPGICER